MHNQQLMKETHKEVSRYYVLSLSPLGMLGTPRAMSGKTMDQWRAIPVMYSLAAIYYILTPWASTYSESVAQGILWGAKTSLGVAIFCHLGLIIIDIQMFKSILTRLESLIKT